MPEAEKVRSMFNSIAPGYDRANLVLSCGLHLYWRKVLLRQVRELLPGCGAERALDLCCGTGALLPGLAGSFKQVIGLDFSEDMLRIAAKQLANLITEKRVNLVQGDALNLEFSDGIFDLVTVAYGLRNLADLERGLREIGRVLKSGGGLVALEFGQPRHPLWRSFFRAYSRHVLPFVGGALTGNRAAYSYLEKTSAEFPCAETLCGVIAGCGFRSVSYLPLAGGVAYLYQAIKE